MTTTTHAGAAIGVKRPLCGYLRLTVDRNGNKIGYDVQRKAIERWAEYADETIGHWYRDKDITAADSKKERPEYEEMLRAVEAGQWGGIAVWRLDRLVRLMYEMERCFRITEDAAAFLVSIDPQPIDSRTDMGKVFMRLVVMFAEMEIVTMKARARGHRLERASRGLYNGGGARPFGFEGAVHEDTDDPTTPLVNSGRIGVAHVPEEVELLREAAHKIAIEGQDWGDIILDWHSRNPPVYGATGAPWAVWTLQRVLTGPRIVGKREALIEDPESGDMVKELVKAQWEPILDEDTWKALKARLSPTGPRGGKRTYLLSGLVVCGRCDRPLTGANRRYPKGGVMTDNATYRCRSGPEDKAKGSCGSLNVIARPVEDWVVAAVLTELRESPDFVNALAEDAGVDQVGLAEAMTVVRECEDALAGLMRQAIRERWSEGERLAAREAYVEMRDEAQRTVDGISRRMAVPLPTPEDRKDLVRWFTAMTFAQQRSLLRAAVRTTVVRPTGRSGPRFDLRRLAVTLADGHEVDGGRQNARVLEPDR